MDYRKLDKNVLIKLTPNQAFIAACLSFKSDFITGESHVHQDSLAQFCHCSTSKIQDAISVFKEVGFIQSIKVHQFKSNPLKFTNLRMRKENQEERMCITCIFQRPTI